MKVQLCPKCNGQGIVSKPPYVPGDVFEWASTSTSFPCDVCRGNKTISVPGDVQIKALTPEDVIEDSLRFEE